MEKWIEFEMVNNVGIRVKTHAAFIFEDDSDIPTLAGIISQPLNERTPWRLDQPDNPLLCFLSLEEAKSFLVTK